MKKLLLSLFMFMLSNAALMADDTDDSAAIKTAEKEPVIETSEDNMDRSHQYVVRHADNIAQWIDGFFGDIETEEEAPYSTLRLRLEGEWDEDNGSESDIKLRGKIHLPKLSKRLSLLFSDSDSETSSADDLATDKRNDSDEVALQYNLREKKYYRFDFKVGIRSSGNLKTSVRYRYERPLSETISGRFSEELRYRGGDGFDTKTRLDFDKTLTEDKVLQWSNRVDWQEEESGIEWRSSFALNKRLDESHAISYYVSARGETQPFGQTSSYGLGVRYRQNIFKPWLFVEVQPNYQWKKFDDVSDRDGVAGLLFRLDAVFERAVK